MLTALSENSENTFTYLTWQLPTPIEMEDIHPTQEGTRQMLQYLDSRVGDIIWNKEVITNNKFYQGVTSIYKYGCLTCANYQGVMGDYCGSCTLPEEEEEHSYGKRGHVSDSSSDEHTVTKKPNTQNDGQQ